MKNINHQNTIIYNNEWLTFKKVGHFVRSFFSYKVEMILWDVQKFSDINFNELKEKHWIEWIILDVDDCIAPHHWNITVENIEIIKQLIWNWFKVVIYSNMKKTSRYIGLENIWVKVMNIKFAKPDKAWFEICLDELWLSSDKVVMVWDNYNTDWGAVYAWIRFIKVEPIELNIKWIKRKVQIFLRDILWKSITKQKNKAT